MVSLDKVHSSTLRTGDEIKSLLTEKEEILNSLLHLQTQLCII